MVIVKCVNLRMKSSTDWFGIALSVTEWLYWRWKTQPGCEWHRKIDWWPEWNRKKGKKKGISFLIFWRGFCLCLCLGVCLLAFSMESSFHQLPDMTSRETLPWAPGLWILPGSFEYPVNRQPFCTFPYLIAGNLCKPTL